MRAVLRSSAKAALYNVRIHGDHLALVTICIRALYTTAFALLRSTARICAIYK